jgi:hypothetical protein
MFGGSLTNYAAFVSTKWVWMRIGVRRGKAIKALEAIESSLQDSTEVARIRMAIEGVEELTKT